MGHSWVSQCEVRQCYTCTETAVQMLPSPMKRYHKSCRSCKATRQLSPSLHCHAGRPAKHCPLQRVSDVVPGSCERIIMSEGLHLISVCHVFDKPKFPPNCTCDLMPRETSQEMQTYALTHKHPQRASLKHDGQETTMDMTRVGLSPIFRVNGWIETSLLGSDWQAIGRRLWTVDCMG